MVNRTQQKEMIDVEEDDGFFYAKYKGVEWCYVPEYGSWTNINEDKLGMPPKEVEDAVFSYMDLKEQLIFIA